MAWLFVLVILLFLVLVVALIGMLFIANRLSSSSMNSRPADSSEYFKRNLLTPEEAQFYSVLVDAVGFSAIVCAKVRIEDVISSDKKWGASKSLSASDSLSFEHFDFLICAQGDCSPLLAIELDEEDQLTVQSQKRDALVNQCCGLAGLPLLRIRVASSYSVDLIRVLMKEALRNSEEKLSIPESSSAAMVAPDS